MTVIETEFVPDPIELAQSMIAVADGLEDRIGPMAAAGETLSADIRQHFETETDPSGTPWPELSDSYVYGGFFRREGRPVTPRQKSGTTLKDTRELMDYASSPERVVVTNNTVFYRTGEMPQYGLAHESGLPDRQNPLPQRSFIGLSMEAAAVIEERFYEWFQGNIDLYPTSTGKLGVRHAVAANFPGVGRRFVPRAAAGLGPL